MSAWVRVLLALKLMFSAAREATMEPSGEMGKDARRLSSPGLAQAAKAEAQSACRRVNCASINHLI